MLHLALLLCYASLAALLQLPGAASLPSKITFQEVEATSGTADTWHSRPYLAGSETEHPQAYRNGSAGTRQRVSLRLGVMSRCPDATFTEAYLDRVIQRTNDKIALELSYIGQVDDEEDYGVKCPHGSAECAGDVHQLCLQHILRPSRAGKDFDLSPTAAQRKFWDFVQCINYDGIPSIGSEPQVRQCLETIKGPKWEKDGVRECVQGDEGKRLLKESVKKSAKLGIQRSATIMLEGRVICIRNGGAWKDCEGGPEFTDFVRQIEEAWDAKNTASEGGAGSGVVA